MSSSGIDAVNSGPLIIRTYLDATSNNTYVLGQYERSIPPNRVLVTSTGGLLVPSDSINISSISISTLTASTIIAENVFASTAYVSTLSTCDIFCPDVLTISSFRQTYLGAEQFEYRSSDPSTIGAFKVELYGSNLLAWRSTSANVDATIVQNNGGGQLVLATDEPVMYINGAANGNNHVGIGTSTPQAHLHIGEPNFSQVYTSNGTFPAPNGIITFEIIGAGGPVDEGSGSGGTGGYIKGTLDLSAYAGEIINVFVGQTGSSPPVTPPNVPSGASYLNITTGASPALFVMAGAGGSSSGDAGVQNGGAGGGGTFTPIIGGSVAIGQDGQGAGGGQGGQTSGGGLGGWCGDPRETANSGSGRGAPTAPFGQAEGGQTVSGPSVLGTPGGSGYTGGGEGCAGGGGSSYIKSGVTIITSYRGDQVPTNLLPGYGRSQQNGYVKISYSSGEASLVTDGKVGIETLNPRAPLDVNGMILATSVSTITIYDINGSGGTSGQVLTAGVSNQVVWGQPGWVGTATSDLNMSNYLIKNLSTGITALDAPNIFQTQVLSQQLPSVGSYFALDNTFAYTAGTSLPLQNTPDPSTGTFPYGIWGEIFTPTPTMISKGFAPPAIYNIYFRCPTTDSGAVSPQSWPVGPIIVRSVLFNTDGSSYYTGLDDKVSSGYVFEDSDGIKYFTFQTTLVAKVSSQVVAYGNGPNIFLSFAWAGPGFNGGNYYFNGTITASVLNNFTINVTPLMNNGNGY